MIIKFDWIWTWEYLDYDLGLQLNSSEFLSSLELAQLVPLFFT